MAPVLSKNLLQKSVVGAASLTTLILAVKLLKKLKADGRKRYVNLSYRVYVTVFFF